MEGKGAQRADRELGLEVADVVEQEQLGLGGLVSLDEQLGVVEPDLLHEVQVLRER